MVNKMLKSREEVRGVPMLERLCEAMFAEERVRAATAS
jgi:hypothetical protein